MRKTRAQPAQVKARQHHPEAGFGVDELRALGQEFLRLRKLRRWSLRRAAAESGISVVAIQNVEGGVANPSLLTVLRLAEVYGQPLDRLVAASREATKVIKMVSGALPLSAAKMTDLTVALTNRSMAAELISISPRDEIKDLPIEAPFFGYLLEGSLVLDFDDGHVERLNSNDAIHISDRFPQRLTNPLARKSVLLCLADLRRRQTGNE